MPRRFFAYRLTKCLTASALMVLAAMNCVIAVAGSASSGSGSGGLDQDLEAALRRAGFTGRVESTLASRLGRPLNPALADLGRQLFFDPLVGLHDDNACAGCHAPAAGFGDTQSIAIGIQSNLLVGPNRAGPRNQRRTPSVVNTAFYPRLMWNGRFFAPSGNPFDNSLGFVFPPPEGTTAFPAGDPVVRHLLIAQAHIPPTELNEAAGFTGTKGTIGPRFDVFDDGRGTPLPLPDASGSRNEPIRGVLAQRLNAAPGYVTLFGNAFGGVRQGQPITAQMFAQAIAEFEFTLVRADAPLDRYARGQRSALTDKQKKGALTFFGKGGCVACHAVAGASNEMFSDFRNHVVGLPQIAPVFGAGSGNTIFDGPGENEDVGAEQVSGNAAERYQFRTSPLRNLALQPTFFHNGAYTRLEDAVKFHLDATTVARAYKASSAGVAADLRKRLGPIDPVLQRIDPLLSRRVDLGGGDTDDLIDFLKNALLDARVTRSAFCALAPTSLPSQRKPLTFEGCAQPRGKAF